MFHILVVFSFVLISVLVLTALLPDTFSLLHTVFEDARVGVSVSPLVLAVTFSFSILVLAQVDVSIGETVASLAVSQTLVPLSFISVTICPLVDSVTMGFILHPLADVTVTVDAFPDSVAVLDTVLPLAVVGVPVLPCVESLAVDPAFEVVSQVLVPVGEPLVAFSMAFILHPGSFVQTAVFIDANTVALAKLSNDLSSVQRLLVLLYGESLTLFEQLEVK